MKMWIIKNLSEILREEVADCDLSSRLGELKNHSLKMITFLARFQREFNACPKIMEFIDNPKVETLEKSLKSAVGEQLA